MTVLAVRLQPLDGIGSKISEFPVYIYSVARQIASRNVETWSMLNGRDMTHIGYGKGDWQNSLFKQANESRGE